MIALHYQNLLPADYDMGIIRERVRTRGHALDEYPGLRFKAYLIREVGVDGSPINEYSPFYVWNDEDNMAAFLWGGDGFGAIVRDFGRPSAKTWVVVGHGSSSLGEPMFATRDRMLLAPDSDPQQSIAAEQTWLEQQLARPGVHTAVTALDPRTWEQVRFTLWMERPSTVEGDVLQVLHLSQPGA